MVALLLLVAPVPSTPQNDDFHGRLASVKSRLEALHRARDEALQPQGNPIAMVQHQHSVPESRLPEEAGPKKNQTSTAPEAQGGAQLGERLAFALKRFQLSNITTGLDQHVFCGLATAAS